MKKIYNWLEGINGLIFFAYMAVICAIHIFLYGESGLSSRAYLVFLLLTIALLAVVCPVLIRKCRGLEIIQRKETLTKAESIKWIAVFFIISFVCLIVWYIAWYPGSFYNDSINQYGQVLSGSYNDWHPVFQTLIAIYIPVRLFGTVESIVLLQIIEYAGVLAYMSYVILKYSNKKWAFLILGYVLLNPITQMMVMNPIKDVSFAMAGILLTVFAIEVYFTNGQWLKKWYRILLVASIMAAGTIFRYNAIFFTIPLLIAFFFYVGKRERIGLIACFLAFYFVVKGPVYNYLDVEKPDLRIVEAVGLPMTVIGNVVKEHPESLDDEMKEFAYSIADPDHWEWGYKCGNFNYIKWTGIDLNAINEAGPLQIVKIMFKCMIKEPEAAFRALFDLTDMVYGIDGDLECILFPSIVENDLGITPQGNAMLQKTLTSYTNLIYGGFLKYVFGYTGIMNVLLVLFALAKSNLKRLEDWKKLLLALPMFFYNFGTMLLLTGDDFRFFYPCFTIIPVAVFLLLCKKDQMEEFK